MNTIALFAALFLAGLVAATGGEVGLVLAAAAAQSARRMVHPASAAWTQ